MPTTTTTYDILISCPGDIQDEIGIIKDTIEQFNELYTKAFHIQLKTSFWRTSSYPQSGGKPQDLLNEQFVQDCDAAIAILWTRFGTPTDNYHSGSEEEIEAMIAADKQVFLYFSDCPVDSSKIDTVQLKRVRAFKEAYKERGIFQSYSSREEFKSLLLGHLSKYFLSLTDIKDANNTKQYPDVILAAVNNGKVENEAKMIDCTARDQLIIDFKTEETLRLIDCISNYHVGTIPSSSINKAIYKSPFYSRPNFPEDFYECINNFAKQVDIVLPNTFFDIGGLRKNSIAPNYINSNLDGTDDEKRKYHDLRSLYHRIRNLLCWEALKRCYPLLEGVHLVIENRGTTFDEDIEVDIAIPKSKFNDYRTFNIPERDVLTRLDDEKNIIKELPV